MKFRKKPVIIEAEQYDGNNNPFNALKEHRCDYRMCPICGGSNEKLLYVETIHDGQQCIVKKGDWIILEPDGIHFYPCKPDIFSVTYEEINDKL